jgi:cytochrome c oxidase subunit 2
MSGYGILLLFVIVAAIVLLIMAFIARTTHESTLPQNDVTPTGYALRRSWLWVLGGITLVALGISLPAFPYPQGRQTGAHHYRVTAMQYSFQVTPAVVTAGDPIVFDVTSKDVNHGFGVYDPAGHLIAQVQAMPQYVNHLPLRLTARGHYTVRCLEYCGIAHAAMQGAFEVR